MENLRSLSLGVVNSTIANKRYVLKLVGMLPIALLLELVHRWTDDCWRQIEKCGRPIIWDDGQPLRVTDVLPPVENFGKKMSHRTIAKIFHGIPNDWAFEARFPENTYYLVSFFYYESKFGNLCRRCNRHLHIALRKPGNVFKCQRTRIVAHRDNRQTRTLLTIVLNKRRWCAMCVRRALFTVHVLDEREVFDATTSDMDVNE